MPGQPRNMAEARRPAHGRRRVAVDGRLDDVPDQRVVRHVGNSQAILEMVRVQIVQNPLHGGRRRMGQPQRSRRQQHVPDAVLRQHIQRGLVFGPVVIRRQVRPGHGNKARPDRQVRGSIPSQPMRLPHAPRMARACRILVHATRLRLQQIHRRSEGQRIFAVTAACRQQRHRQQDEGQEKL